MVSREKPERAGRQGTLGRTTVGPLHLAAEPWTRHPGGMPSSNGNAISVARVRSGQWALCWGPSRQDPCLLGAQPTGRRHTPGRGQVRALCGRCSVQEETQSLEEERSRRQPFRKDDLERSCQRDDVVTETCKKLGRSGQTVAVIREVEPHGKVLGSRLEISIW